MLKKLLSERKVLNAILRLKLKYMKDVSFSWNEMLFAMQKTDFHVLELFCRASQLELQCTEITSLELLRTLMLCLVQLSKWRESKAKDAEKLLSQWEKVAKCNFKSKAQVHERCFFLMKWNVICNVEDRFWCVRAFCRASHVRASMHRITGLELLRTLMLCLVQLSKWRECKATDAEKLLSQWEKVANKLFCRASHVRVSMHRITGLELLRTLMLCLVQTKQMKRIQGHGCWKPSQFEKVAKCNFKSNSQVHERYSFSWNEMLFAMQKTDFHVRAFFKS